MHSVPDRNFSASNMQLLVGQRNLNGHSLFKVKKTLINYCKLKFNTSRDSFLLWFRVNYKTFIYCLVPMDICYNVNIWIQCVPRADNFCNYNPLLWNYNKTYLSLI